MSGDADPVNEPPQRDRLSLPPEIGELLDFTRNRPESGMPLDRRQVDLAELVGATVEEIRVAHSAAKVTLTVEGSCVGNWDSDRLAQVTSNLVGNALEHTSNDAPVAVALRGGPAEVLLVVSNHGTPIPESLRATLFEPFRQGRRKRSTQGVGLGLYIVSQIVRAHGGKLWVDSDASGTHFYVSLPLA